MFKYLKKLPADLIRFLHRLETTNCVDECNRTRRERPCQGSTSVSARRIASDLHAQADSTSTDSRRTPGKKLSNRAIDGAKSFRSTLRDSGSIAGRSAGLWRAWVANKDFSELELRTSKFQIWTCELANFFEIANFTVPFSTNFQKMLHFGKIPKKFGQYLAEI